MAKIFFMTTALLFCLQINVNAAEATNPTAKPKKITICERLTKQAEDNCIEAMCEEAYGENNECIMDGDFNEGLSVCISDNQLPSLIEAYNKKHPRKNLICEN